MSSRESALIGESGFVGSSLAAQGDFGAAFGSGNIRDAHGRHFSDLFCAAAPGSMFEANRLPQEDERRIDALIADLARVRADRFVLISTIAVLDRFDAGYDESAGAFQQSLAYGRNRRRLEEFCVDHFDDVLVVRLPALFGPGLKKNFMFDILNPMPGMLPVDRFEDLRGSLPGRLGSLLSDLYTEDVRLGVMMIDRGALDRTGLRSAFDEAMAGHDLNAVRFTNPDSCFQYYDMSRLSADIEKTRAAGVDIIHLAPEPLAAREIYEALVGHQMPSTGARVHREDLRTRHASLWSRTGPYIASAGDVLERLHAFHRAEKCIA